MPSATNLRPRRLVVAVLAAGALGFAACQTKEEKAQQQKTLEQASAALAITTDLAAQVDAWIAQTPKLCPLADAEIWVAPLATAVVAPTEGGLQRYSAQVSFWCRGRSADGDKRRISAVAHVPPKGPKAFDYDAATIADIEDVSLIELLLYWPVAAWVAAFLVALFWRFVGLSWLLVMFQPVGELIFVIVPTALGVVLIGAASVVAACFWTSVVFHGGWTYVLTPLLFVPTFSMWTSAYLHRIKAAGR